MLFVAALADMRTQESWVQEVIITPAVGLVKICVCLFYKRIFTVPRFKMAANIVIVVTVCWTIAFTVVSPIHALFLLVLRGFLLIIVRQLTIEPRSV